LYLVFKMAPISDNVAKFPGDRPRNRGDLALNKKKKKKKETAAKHKGRGCVVATGGPNKQQDHKTTYIAIKLTCNFIKSH